MVFHGHTGTANVYALFSAGIWIPQADFVMSPYPQLPSLQWRCGLKK